MKKKFLRWLTTTRFYKHVLMNIIPYIRLTTYYTSLRGAKYHEGYAELKPGHIILTVDRKKLTSLLIPGEMSHASLCVGKIDINFDFPGFEVAEMTHHDYTESFFFDICKESDRVVIMECVEWDEAYTQAVVEECLKLQNAKYDIAFDLGVEQLYCSELVYQSDKRAADRLNDHSKRLNLDLSDLEGLGTKYISPDGLLFGTNLRCVWDSDNGEFEGMMGPEIEKTILNYP